MRKTREDVLWTLDDVGFNTTTFHDDNFLNLIAAYAPKTDHPVLIIGETGTGKELIAKAIHQLSEVKGNFIPFLCAGIPSTLIDAHLFGSKRGAYTGAKTDKKGVFEQANNGTVFLDEIGDVPPEVQTKLLRVLNDGSFTPLGDDHGKEKKTTARIISATNKNIQHEPDYRKDLYYRLGVFEISLPPLREKIQEAKRHKDMLRNLFDSFLSHNVSCYCQLTNDAIDKLAAYHWPGNYRELKSVLLRAYAENEGHTSLAGHVFMKFGGDDLKDGEFAVIDASMIRLDTEKPLYPYADVSGMTALETLNYAEQVYARIVDQKFQSYVRGKIKQSLIEEGVPPNKYQGLLKRMKALSKKVIRP